MPPESVDNVNAGIRPVSQFARPPPPKVQSVQSTELKVLAKNTSEMAAYNSTTFVTGCIKRVTDKQQIWVLAR